MKQCLILMLCLLGGLSVLGSKLEAKDNARRERVQQLIVTRLANGLNLSQPKAQALGNVLKTHWQRKKQLKNEVNQLTAQLRQETASKNSKASKETLKKLNTAQEALNRSNEVMFAEVKTMLDADQLAQFVLIMDEIRHEIRAVKGQGTTRRYQEEDRPNPYFQNPPPPETRENTVNRPYPYYPSYRRDPNDPYDYYNPRHRGGIIAE